MKNHRKVKSQSSGNEEGIYNTGYKLCEYSSERNSNLNNPLKKDHIKVKSQNSETEDSTQHVNYVTMKTAYSM